MTKCEDHKWQPGDNLPPAIAGTLKGLLAACKESGVPIGSLFAHEVLRNPDAIQNRDHIDAQYDSRSILGYESLPRMYWFLQKRLIDIRSGVDRMLRARDIQVDMISELAAERNKLLDYKKWYEEAMAATNEAGYSCQDAASVIRDMAGLLNKKQEDEM